ncbi:unnamed protein product, partial [marine sediment metagenome]
MHKEKTNREIILETLEECSRPIEENEENFDIKNAIKNDSAYRLPMKKMINSYAWANFNKPGKALIPVIGNYQDKHT